MKKTLLILLTLLVVLAIVACNNDEDNEQQVDQEPEEKSDEVAEQEEEQEEDAEELPSSYYAPLTGISFSEESTHPILAVMINNHNQARPQSGLNQADMVYEVLAEGWITRYLALFQSRFPEVIGPVRSARPYYLDLADGFEAILAHAGGSSEARQRIEDEGFPSLDGLTSSASSFYRVDFRKMPHNLYTGAEQLEQELDKRGYSERDRFPTLLFKESTDEMTGEEAGWIDIEYHPTYYEISYEYHPETQLYTRYVRGELDIDREAEEPLTMTNIFIIETEHEVIDDQLRRDIDVLSGGKGYLFQRGKVQEVDWQRIDGIIRPMKDGQEIGLYPGVTWVNIIPDSPGIEENVQYKLSKDAE